MGQSNNAVTHSVSKKYSNDKKTIEHLLRYIKYDSIFIYLEEQKYSSILTDLIELIIKPGAFSNEYITENLFKSVSVHEHEIDDYCRALLSKKQYSQLVSYISRKNYYRSTFGENEKFNVAIALAFGENQTVNLKLAKEIEARIGTQNHNETTVFAQSEVFNLIDGKNRYSNLIEISREGDKYLDTKRIIEKVLNSINNDSNKVSLFAQSWHAARSLELCQNKGLNIVQGIFVDAFSPDDPQPWVRDVLSWVIKEAQK